MLASTKSNNTKDIKDSLFLFIQERLSQLIQSQIRAEVSQKPFPDLCDSLQNIDIAISFLKSVSTIRTSSFSDFMIQTLQLGDSCFGQKVLFYSCSVQKL